MNRKSARSSRFCFLVSLALVTCTPAAAQYRDNMGGSWNNPTSASIGNIINDQIWNRLRAKARAQKNGSSSTTKAAPEPSTSQKTTAQINAAVRFRSTGTQLKTQAIANELTSGGTPEAKKQMFDTLSLLLTEYEKAARAQGKPNDLALALTAALVYNSSIYNGTPEPDDARIMEIRDALAELATEAGTFATMSDRQKQELYETAVISTMLAKAGYETAKSAGDQNTMAIYRALAGQTLQAVSGMPPEKINLTNQPAPDVSGSPATNSTGEPIEHWTILEEYRDNQVAAAAKYNGKRITIVGAVDFILVEKGKQLARMSVPAWSGIQMFCVFAPSQSAVVANIQPNQRVVMECTVLGDTGGVTRIGRVDLGSSVGRYTLDNCLIK